MNLFSTEPTFCYREILKFWGLLSTNSFLLYVNDVPQSLKELELYLYTEDTYVYNQQKAFQEIVNVVNREISNLSQWFVDNKLLIYFREDKTKYFIGKPYHITSLHYGISWLLSRFKPKWRISSSCNCSKYYYKAKISAKEVLQPVIYCSAHLLNLTLINSAHSDALY